MRDNQDIGKHNRRIDIEAPQRLQRDLGSKFRPVAKIEESTSSLSHCSIFRKITSSLTHEPYRPSFRNTSIQHVEQWLVIKLGHSIKPIKNLKDMESLLGCENPELPRDPLF